MNETYRYRKLLQFGTLLLRESKPGDLQRTLFELLPEVIDIDAAALFIKSDRERWTMRAASGSGILLKSIRPRLKQFAKKVNEEEEDPIAVAAPLIIDRRRKRNGKEFPMVAAFPLVLMGRITAFIVAARATRRAFTTEDLNRLDYVAAILSTTMENQFVVQKLRHHADSLELERANLETKFDQRTRELTREREFASFLQECGPHLVFVLDGKGRILFANPVCHEATGFPVEDLAGRRFIDLCYPAKCPEKEEWTEALLKTPESQSFQTTLVAKGGEHRVITWNAIKRTDEKGRPEEVICIGMDVTRTAHLETHNRVLLETLPDGLFRVNDRFEVVEINRQAAELMGLDPNEILGKKCYETVCTESRESCPVFTGGRDAVTYETTMPVPGGNAPHVLKSIRRYRLGAGEFALETFKDITRLKRMERKVRDYAENLERKVMKRTAELREAQVHLFQSEKLAATGRLAAAVAHEINNPIYGIRGCLQSVLEEAELGEELLQFVKLALKETDRISDLVRRMHNFQWDARGERKPVDVTAVLKDVLFLNNKMLQERKIRLGTCFTPNLPKALLCADEIKQVFFNLINNAVESMPDGGDLTVTTAARGATVEIEFIDTGAGMPREVRERIFDAFFTTKSAVKGVGLGLPVCWGIIRGHGGRILVESEEGKGSSFVVVLPAASKAHESGKAGRASEEQGGTAAG